MRLTGFKPWVQAAQVKWGGAGDCIMHPDSDHSQPVDPAARASPGGGVPPASPGLGQPLSHRSG